MGSLECGDACLSFFFSFLKSRVLELFAQEHRLPPPRPPSTAPTRPRVSRAGTGVQV